MGSRMGSRQTLRSGETPDCGRRRIIERLRSESGIRRICSSIEPEFHRRGAPSSLRFARLALTGFGRRISQRRSPHHRPRMGARVSDSRPHRTDSGSRTHRPGSSPRTRRPAIFHLSSHRRPLPGHRRRTRNSTGVALGRHRAEFRYETHRPAARNSRARLNRFSRRRSLGLFHGYLKFIRRSGI